MNEEEKKNLEHIKKRADYVSRNILGTNVFTTYDVHCVNMLIEMIEKQQKEIEELKQKNKKCEYYEMVSDELYKNSISKDKIKPIQIIDLDGKIHNVYKIEE